ncbi:uncharacterized protein LOC128390838 [Panonychus citri]|uniref:uncharacterized protein LOC128390838 n=1 Tax=Panonychus citri TaxID=50023 RepID=UPI002308357E|nr:uncharacterized protein LOC128390838 [Panonychus citri]
MFKSIILVLALVGSSFAGIVDFRTCEGNLNPPQVVSIEGCEGFQCDFEVGSKVNVQVEFVSPIAANSVAAISTVGTESSTVQACNSGLNCPLAAGEYYTYKGSFTVGRSSVSAKSLTYQLQSNNQALACFTFPVTVA